MLLRAQAGYSDSPRLQSWLSLQPTLKVLGARWKVGGEQEGDRRCAAPEGDGVPVLEVVGEVPVLPPGKHTNKDSEIECHLTAAFIFLPSWSREKMFSETKTFKIKLMNALKFDYLCNQLRCCWGDSSNSG